MDKIIFRQIVILALSCLVVNTLQLKLTSSVLKRHSLIHHELPTEFNVQETDPITQHHITQRLDNFNHQDIRTFQMVYIPVIDSNICTTYFSSMPFSALFEESSSF